jgi:hypothetical protein
VSCQSRVEHQCNRAAVDDAILSFVSVGPGGSGVLRSAGTRSGTRRAKQLCLQVPSPRRPGLPCVRHRLPPHPWYSIAILPAATATDTATDMTDVMNYVAIYFIKAHSRRGVATVQ